MFLTLLRRIFSRRLPEGEPEEPRPQPDPNHAMFVGADGSILYKFDAMLITVQPDGMQWRWEVRSGSLKWVDTELDRGAAFLAAIRTAAENMSTAIQ